MSERPMVPDSKSGVGQPTGGSNPSFSATSHKKKNVMVISAVERQAYLLFEKILFYLEQNHKKMIMKGKDRRLFENPVKLSKANLYS